MVAVCTGTNCAVKSIDIGYSVVVDVELFLVEVYERIYISEDFR
jgi:hypothetical protein